MIVYKSCPLDLSILFRIHGSATYKSVPTALLSTGIYFIIEKGAGFSGDNTWFLHPYPISTLMVAFTFLLTFKASFSYNRYWEACTAVHQMHSKWLDVGMEIASFHLQSQQYDKIRPRAFGSNPDKKFPMKRELNKEHSRKQLNEVLQEEEGSLSPKIIKLFTRNSTDQKMLHKSVKTINKVTLSANVNESSETPSLLLQEASHLLSLLSAVAFSTLRNDVEKAESPLMEYQVGDNWPPVDPDDKDAIVRPDFKEMPKWQKIIYFLCGFARTPAQRTRYNASRPFRVLGGVSDEEIEALQRMRGPLAKTALCTMWLQEFICRENAHGSFGNVPPPIISRLFQFTSDGMVGYNQARKIAYIPFPFVHNQLTASFILVMIFFLPVLMLSYVTNLYVGAALNAFAVSIFVGLYEVAKEMEDPFKNAPNDIPLNYFQAQFNEALFAMYAGYHPEAKQDHSNRNDAP